MNPALLLRGESACRNQTVDMRMQKQVLPPRVQDTDEPNLSAQAFGVCCNLQHGGGAGMEEQIVHDPGVTLAKSIQLMWQGEDDVGSRGQRESSFSLAASQRWRACA